MINKSVEGYGVGFTLHPLWGRGGVWGGEGEFFIGVGLSVQGE